MRRIGAASARACVFSPENAPKNKEKSKMRVTDSSSCFKDSSSSLVALAPRERKTPGLSPPRSHFLKCSLPPNVTKFPMPAGRRENTKKSAMPLQQPKGKPGRALCRPWAAVHHSLAFPVQKNDKSDPNGPTGFSSSSCVAGAPANCEIETSWW